MNREQLIAGLHNHTPDNEERPFIPDFLDLLRHPDAFQRHHLPGHLTGSAWIIDDAANFVLLTHHMKLKRWLQPGGHADGCENILQVALREAAEETGLRDLQLVTESIFDVDIHTIPARKDFPRHLHYDVRFLLRGNRTEPLTITAESQALSWIPLDQVDAWSEWNVSMLRMTRKVRALF